MAQLFESVKKVLLSLGSDDSDHLTPEQRIQICEIAEIRKKSPREIRALMLRYEISPDEVGEALSVYDRICEKPCSLPNLIRLHKLFTEVSFEDLSCDYLRIMDGRDDPSEEAGDLIVEEFINFARSNEHRDMNLAISRFVQRDKFQSDSALYMSDYGNDVR